MSSEFPKAFRFPFTLTATATRGPAQEPVPRQHQQLRIAEADPIGAIAARVQAKTEPFLRHRRVHQAQTSQKSQKSSNEFEWTNYRKNVNQIDIKFVFKKGANRTEKAFYVRPITASP